MMFGPTAAALAFAWIGGVLFGGLFFPPGRRYRAELIGWGAALGLGAVGVAEALAVTISASFWPAWLFFVAPAVTGLLWRRRTQPAVEPSGPAGRFRALAALLVVVALLGVLLAALRALAEPMWSNDFLAIWGLKAKAIALSPDGKIPRWLFDPEIAGYSHPEYPLGLPLVLAGLARFAGGWDDQALALVYPLLLVATLLVLYGWLRRRGATPVLALSAVALLALFEPLYSAFLTGMAEVPLSLTILLVGTSLSDVLDETDSRAIVRLTAASLLAASVKNEGLFIAVAAAVLALPGGAGGRRRPGAAAAAALPALAVTALARVLHGPAPLRDFDLGLLAPGRWSELAARLVRALDADGRLAAGALPVLAAVAILFACGRRAPWADRLLVLALAALAAYLALPALAVLGPEWLARTTLARTSAALVPLAAAGLAGRLVAVYSPPPAGASALASER